MDLAHKTEMMQTLDSMLEARSLTDRVVFLFGYANATLEIADELIERGVDVRAILDNSPSKQGQVYRGIPVVQPDTVLIQEWPTEVSQSDERQRVDTQRKSSNETMKTADIVMNSVVLIASRFYEEMAAQLRRIGYQGEIVQVVKFDSSAEYSLSDDTVKRMTERMQRGAEVLARIRDAYPMRHLVVCPNGALGDVYWAMAFLPAYCKKNGIDEVAVIVAGGACHEVAALFGIEGAISISQQEMDELVQAIIFTGETNCIIAHHDKPYTDNIIRYLDRHFLSFIDYYRCAVYGLQKDTPAVAPMHGAPFDGQFDSQVEMPQGKSVILSPYASSVIELPKAYWKTMAAEYEREGYAVYTNVAGNETSVPGTKPLRLPISQMIAAAEYAGAFVSIRNGLCDVLHTANCQKTVVFPDCYYSTTPFKVENFFALPGWEKRVVKQSM